MKGRLQEQTKKLIEVSIVGEGANGGLFFFYVFTIWLNCV